MWRDNDHKLEGTYKKKKKKDGCLGSTRKNKEKAPEKKGQRRGEEDEKRKQGVQDLNLGCSILFEVVQCAFIIFFSSLF
jgi:hypothetical protein